MFYFYGNFKLYITPDIYFDVLSKFKIHSLLSFMSMLINITQVKAIMKYV